MDVSLDGGEHHATTTALVRLLHEGLEVSDGHFHGFGALKDKGELHFTRGE